ncbi:MAG: hypothetical protein LBF67_05540 [Prevotellaceae bacterium]|jgi:uncharacterized protein YneR|nr:hypothetical protein [Prevotellaceae bacterium]
MQQQAHYDNLTDEATRYLSEKVNMPHGGRIRRYTGFGFAKTAEQNFEMPARMEEFKNF